MKRSLEILVVDDYRDHADSLAELFELEGHKVRVAYAAADAIAAFVSQEFDVAFMDVVMPGMNGVESFLEIRRRRPDAKVYMMTGYSVEELLAQAIENGALGVISKPISADKVAHALDEVAPHGIVLVAEDDPDLGPAICAGLACHGKSCELVTDGRQALDRVTAGGVDVLVLDLKMPLISGIDVLRALRERGRTVPTIMVTGNAGVLGEGLADLGDVALTGILNKPFDIPALLELLDRLAAPAASDRAKEARA